MYKYDDQNHLTTQYTYDIDNPEQYDTYDKRWPYVYVGYVGDGMWGTVRKRRDKPAWSRG